MTPTDKKRREIQEGGSSASEAGDGTPPSQASSGWSKGALYGGAAVGCVTAVAAAPFVLTGVGFTSAGISASSYAASMMSSAAVANGGGVAAGSVVATLQSIGAVGLGAKTFAAVGAAGAAAGAGVVKVANLLNGTKQEDEPTEGNNFKSKL